MSVSVNALQSHINVTNGLSNPFEALQMDIEMNLRSDLVRCHGFSVEFVSKLSEDEVYHFIDCIEDGIDPLEEMETTYSNEYGFTCSKCSDPVNIHYTDCMGDGYLTDCKCGHMDFILVYVVDNILESREAVQLQNVEEIKEQIQSELETNLKIEEMGFSERTFKVLEKHSIKTEQQLRRLELLDLMKMRDMGKKSILEIEEKLNIRYDW